MLEYDCSLFYVIGVDCPTMPKFQAFEWPQQWRPQYRYGQSRQTWWRQTHSAGKTTHSASAVNSGRWIGCQGLLRWSTCSAVSTSRWENRHSSNALRRSPSNEPKQSASNSGAQVHSQERGDDISKISCPGNSGRDRMMRIIVCLTSTVYYSFYTFNHQFYVEMEQGGRDNNQQ